MRAQDHRPKLVPLRKLEQEQEQEEMLEHRVLHKLELQQELEGQDHKHRLVQLQVQELALALILEALILETFLVKTLVKVSANLELVPPLLLEQQQLQYLKQRLMEVVK